jgi:hypothetical protein
MKHVALVLLPLFGALALAQDAPKPDVAALVKQLGDDDYAVREAATKKLVELGESAVPALEKALKSEDLEVRLRAGRALRAIRGGKAPARPEEDGKPDPKSQLRDGARVVGTSLNLSNGKVELSVTTMDRNGKRETRKYEAKSMEELYKQHPELKKVLGNFRFKVGPGNAADAAKRFRFDMDKFWKEWGKDLNDDFWKDWQKDLEKEAERMRKLTEQWRKEWAQRQLPRGFDWPGMNMESRGKLGAAASRPSRVLDAQLGLRGRGVVIERVMARSLANQLGLQRYDVLMKINGAEVRSYNDIALALKDYKDGDEVAAEVLRKAKLEKLSTR